MASLKSILKELRGELKVRNHLREEMLTKARKITRLAKQAIIAIQQDKLGEAEKRLLNAKKLLEKTGRKLEGRGELQSSGALSAAHEEFAEGMILLKLEREGAYPTREEVGVPASAYILGLGDVVGELRRRALDAIRERETEDAERSLSWMEEIYNELMLIDEYVFSILPGLRRKCDVARRLIESTRGDVVIESRRRLLEDSLRRLERKVKTGRKP